MERKRDGNTPSPSHIIHASISSFIIFVILGLLITLPLLPRMLQNHTLLPLLLVIWVPVLAFVAWVFSHYIVLDPDRIRYVALFKSHEVLFSAITRVQVRATRGRGASYILQIYAHSGNQPLEISVRPFSRRSMAIVVDTIASSAPSAGLDGLAQEMRQGTLR